MTEPTANALSRVAVTGGSSGLGAAVVRAVQKRGGTAVVLDRQKPADDGPFVEVDLSDPHAAEGALAAAEEQIGPLTGVVTAAGTDACGLITDVSLDDWVRVISVNLIGTAAIARAAVPRLERTHGRIVTVASTLGLRALSDATAYCASKFGVVGFSRALAVETAGRVGVTMLVPGGMQTAFFDGRPDQYKPGPDAVLNDPANVAETVVYALSQPPGVEIRELVVTPSVEPSWP
ncbi:short-chain dehydrogenase/reductase SDR [Kribbella flavida DSM 17836]|uniref:Short-chain dehydrogenase/reductase SDR n=1 Tax=Kribbella flavida (strain DSM 17836 / JCM 10339 / NBRC 14399) TaxID=479435 RepID=D2PXF0_KRIFD|nr:SDR family oxidoreductase [Kribbella flavida]ADB29798.1 short-chain dehydrogenase/reductase SDR [Kribbella flavida DSM 17836]